MKVIIIGALFSFFISQAAQMKTLEQELIELADAGDLSGLGFFLDKNKNIVNVNATDNQNRTALWLISRISNVPLLSDVASAADSLLVLGADPNIADSVLGLTPLMNAAGLGNDDLVTILINKGAKVNMQDPQGFTALSFAINYKRNTTKNLLRKLGGKTRAELAKTSAERMVILADRLNRLNNQLNRLSKMLGSR